jgi:branched-chain amino acid transport system permease protein
MMVWSIFALAYNLLHGYTGLTSLGHGLFFGAGMYGVAFSFRYLGVDGLGGLAIGAAGAMLVATVVGFLSLRVRGLYFLILTLIFSMVFYAAALSYPQISGGSSGLVLELPGLLGGGTLVTLLKPVSDFYVVLAFLAGIWALVLRIVRSPVGLVLQGIRENEERARLLGYHVERYKLFAFALSGLLSGIAGALYTSVFRFAAPEFLNVPTSVNVLMWTLVGGAGTVLGPVVGTFLMISVVDYVSSFTSSFLIVVGVVLIVTVTRVRRGLVGSILSWLSRRGS